jgi:hypothetical protein
VVGSEAVKAAKPFRSGFCNESFPLDDLSHERCTGGYNGNPCICVCHIPIIDGEVTAGLLPSIPSDGADEAPDEAKGLPNPASPSVPSRSGFFPDVPEDQYHSDPHSLSQSGAKLLLRAPALFQHAKQHREVKDSFDFGSAAHALVLGKGIEQIYVAPFNDWIKRKGPEGGCQYTSDEKRIAHEDGLSPILPKDWDVVCDMAGVLSQHKLAMELLSEGEAEVSAYVVDEPTGILRRCRYDWINGPLEIGVDYKSTDDASPEAFARSVLNYGYDQQADWYLDVAALLGRPMKAFCFIAQEKKAPYLVEVYDLSEEFLERGHALNRRALDIYAECIRTGRWPGYTDQPFTTLNPPAWARKAVA